MADCRIVGAFDTETTNIGNALEGYEAFPILYQYGRVKYNIEGLTPENVFKNVEVSIARSENDIYPCFDRAIADAAGYYVPVVLVHNLGFDMYALAPYLRAHNVRVLAKTAKKPISFQVLGENGKPALIFLDTLGLFMKSLKVLGDECGMPKAVGDWDYNLVRTCSTELTEAELGYAKQDIYTLLCYMAYFLRQNPDIKQADIGNRVQTKTGVVRAKRLVHVGNTKARNANKSVRQLWHLLNQEQRPKSDDELFTMQAATRGGYTFCARNNASRVYMASDDLAIESYDSTSQHPAQMVSHLYPQRFKEATPEQLGLAFSICSNIGVERLLKAWLKPFPFAFHAAFEFENLRPKEESIFASEGIFPLASARIGGKAPVFENEAASEFKDYSASLGYGDRVSNPTFAYGKLEACDKGIFYLTELDAWIISRSYDWDNVKPLHGYMSSTFRKAPDMAVLSVMRYYGAKDALKWFMESYIEGQENDASRIAKYYPASFVSRCKSGQAEKAELKEYYMLSKADLNSLFGIEATNECRRDYEMHDANGLELVGTDGIHNLPKSSKAFYQFGQRIVGWSRVAQVCIMELVAPFVDSIICGDTDSIKIAFDPANRPLIERELKRHARFLDRAKHAATARARAAYKNLYIPLKGIGHYVFDGAYEGFSASWNKSYIGLVDGKCKLTIAGMPTTRRSLERDDSFNDFCNDLLSQGLSFQEVASLAIGYNVTIDASISKLNARLHPQEFGGRVFRKVEDYRGNVDIVDAPAALALFPFPKTLGDTSSIENARNMTHALANNPDVNTAPILLRWEGGKAVIER